MRFHRGQFLIYAVTDRVWTGGRSLCRRVGEALKGGAITVQFREKSLEKKNFNQILGETKALRELTQRYHVPLIIDDNMDLTEACNTDGLHVEQDDMDAQTARRILGPDRILGVTAGTVEQALRAQAQGADYLGSDAVFGTTTKTDACPIAVETLREICNSVDVPVVATGGINLGNIRQLSGSYMTGATIVSGIFAAEDICGTTQYLVEEVKKSLNLFPKTVDNSKWCDYNKFNIQQNTKNC